MDEKRGSLFHGDNHEYWSISFLHNIFGNRTTLQKVYVKNVELLYFFHSYSINLKKHEYIIKYKFEKRKVGIKKESIK